MQLNRAAPATNWPSKFASRTAQMRRSAVRELLKLTTRPEMISFAGGLPAPEVLPVSGVRAAAQAVLSKSGGQALQYGETQGVAELRDWIAGQFARTGLPITRSNVVITSGAQQGLDLIGRVLLETGDRVIVENPTYLALLSSWRPLGVEFIPVSSDADGICMQDLERVLDQRPKLLYTVPNFQNPQGTTLSGPRRDGLVSLLREHNAGLVEDDPYHDLRYRGESLPRLLEIDAQVSPGDRFDSNVIHTGTFSKVLAPGLRIGWLIGSEEVVEKIVQAKQAADLHTSTLSQYITLELLREGLLDRRIPLLKNAYREKCDAMLAALEKYFPNDVTWSKPDGGMFLMVKMPAEIDASELLKRAIEVNVAFVPGEEFHLNGQGRNTLRLNFSHAPVHKIEEGIRTLGGLF